MLIRKKAIITTLTLTPRMGKSESQAKTYPEFDQAGHQGSSCSEPWAWFEGALPAGENAWGGRARYPSLPGWAFQTSPGSGRVHMPLLCTSY